MTYLNGRQQYVQMDNVHSGFKKVIRGIPQGAILGPDYIGRLARMSVLDTEVDGSNPGSSMLFP